MNEVTSEEDLSFDGPVSARPVADVPVPLEDVDIDPEDDLVIDAVDELSLHDFEDEAPTQPLSPLPTNYEYQDWDPKDTRVLTYTTNPQQYPKDRTTPSKAAAEAAVKAAHGRILETNVVPGRFFFRVKR